MFWTQCTLSSDPHGSCNLPVYTNIKPSICLYWKQAAADSQCVLFMAALWQRVKNAIMSEYLLNALLNIPVHIKKGHVTVSMESRVVADSWKNNALLVMEILPCSSHSLGSTRSSGRAKWVDYAGAEFERLLTLNSPAPRWSCYRLITSQAANWSNLWQFSRARRVCIFTPKLISISMAAATAEWIWKWLMKQACHALFWPWVPLY